MLLRPRITIAFLLTSVIPIFIVGVLTYSYVKASMEQSVFDGIHVISELKEANLFLYLDTIKTTTRNFSSDGFIRDASETIHTKTTNKEKTVKSLNHHLIKNKAPLNADILYIDILNLNGIVTSSTRQERIGLDKSKEQYFIKSKKEVYIRDIKRNNDGDLEIAFSAPLFSRLNSSLLIGTLVNHCTINSIKDLFDGKLVLGMGAKTQSRGIGSTGESYLVNMDKLMINNSLYIDNASFRQNVDTYPVKMSLEHDKEVIGIWKDYRGVDVVGSSMSIEINDFKWTLISEQDVDEAFDSVVNLKKTFVIIIIIVTVLTFLTSIIISRKITHPIGLLTSELEALGKGNEHTRLKDIKNNDEIGFLARTFELMSSKLNDALEDIHNKNKQLEELSNNDGLTGLINHRHIKEILDMEFNRSYRYKSPLCCIMLDIDFFKSINDTYGHLFGDVVLKGVAAIIKKGCRKSDFAARYGGEEFVIILPNTELNQAQVVAEKLFEMISTENYFDDKNKISITVSIGISFFHDGIKKYSDMLAEADKAMYQAKNSGRNRVYVFEHEESS